MVLANDPAYWSRPAHGHATNADAFRIYEGQQLAGRRAWGPLTGAGTMKDRASPIELRGSYLCHWAEYSSLPGSRGTFRLLALAVSPGDAADQAPAAGRQQRQPETAAHLGLGQGKQVQSAELVPGDQAGPRVTREQGTAPRPGGQHYSASDLRRELLRFERELREAGFADNSVQTYVDRARRFLRWLEGDYQPRAPSLRCSPPPAWRNGSRSAIPPITGDAMAAATALLPARRLSGSARTGSAICYGSTAHDGADRFLFTAWSPIFICQTSMINE